MFYLPLLFTLICISKVLAHPGPQQEIPAGVFKPQSNPNPQSQEDKNIQVWKLLNAERAKDSLRPLAWNEGLVAIAAGYNEVLKKSKKLIQQQSNLRDPEVLKRVASYGVPLLFLNGFTTQNVKSPEMLIDAIMTSELWKRMVKDPQANIFGASLNGCFWTVEVGMIQPHLVVAVKEPSVKGEQIMNTGPGRTHNIPPLSPEEQQDLQREKNFLRAKEQPFTKEEEQLMLELVNNLRSAKSIRPLCIDRQLKQAALEQNNLMEKTGEMTHKKPEGEKSTGDLLREILGTTTNYSQCIAKGKATPREAFKYWMNTAPYNEYMIDPLFNSVYFQRIGANYTMLLVQDTNAVKKCE